MVDTSFVSATLYHKGLGKSRVMCKIDLRFFYPRCMKRTVGDENLLNMQKFTMDFAYTASQYSRSADSVFQNSTISGALPNAQNVATAFFI